MKQQYLEAGQIVGTHGVRGEVKILPWCDSAAFLAGFDTLYLDGAPHAVESARVHKNMALCKLSGVDDLTAAAALKNKVVQIDRSCVDIPPGRVLIADLLGLPVFAGETQIGVLSDVYASPANDVYVVTGAGKTYQIPAVSAFLEDVNVEGGYIRVRLLEGMETDAH